MFYAYIDELGETSYSLNCDKNWRTTLHSISNVISVSRMVLSLSLLILRPLSMQFFIVYMICGISDIVDGYIARRTNTVTRLGARLDSLSDLVMVSVVCFILIPMVNLEMKMIVWIIVIVSIRLLSMLIVFIKYQTVGIMHTIGNKITGILLFLFPLTMSTGMAIQSGVVVCIIATVSASEELVIHLISNKLELDRKSIFL